MKSVRDLAVGGACAALDLICAAPALAAGTAVSVRVEGATRTLLPASTVHTHSGDIRTGGTPRGACPATSAAGALDVATHHRWNGSWDRKYQALSVTSILGETHPLTATTKYYRAIYVNNAYASAGICALHLPRGEQVLLAAVPNSANIPHPLAISAPRRAIAGQPFRVRVTYSTPGGRARPLAGVSMGGAAKTNRQGFITLRVARGGVDHLTVGARGYIRAEATIAVAGPTFRG